MIVIATFDLDNRHAPDSDLLEAYVRDAVAYFNNRVQAGANLRAFCPCSDEVFEHGQRMALVPSFPRFPVPGPARAMGRSR